MVRKKKKKSNSLVLEQLQNYPELVCKHLGNLLIIRQSQAIKHLPEQEKLINIVFKKCFWILIMILKSKKFREKIIFTPGSPVKNKWMTFLDKFDSYLDLNIQSMYLFRTLLQELISKEKDFRPYWNHAYLELSEKLSSHIETDLVGLDSTLSSSWLLKQVEKSPFLEITRQKLQNKNSQMTFYPSSTSLVADKWEEEVIQNTKFKTVQIQIFPTENQKTHLKKTFDVYRYVKNKTLEYIDKKGYNPSWKSLRNSLVTENTKTSSEEYLFFNRVIKYFQNDKETIIDDYGLEILESDISWVKYLKKENLKNKNSIKNDIRDFELEIDKDIRTCSVKSLCDNIKTVKTLFKNGNIKWYKMKFKKKYDPKQNIKLSSRLIDIKNGEVLINLGKVQGHQGFDKYRMSYKNKKKYKNLNITHDICITLNKGKYVLQIPIDICTKPIKINNSSNYCGVDPGVRTLLTVFSNTGITEYQHDKNLIKTLYNKKDFLKNLKRKKIRKKQINKIEKKEKSIIDIIHWKCINDLLINNDIIYMGDIKSHNIVKNGVNKKLNRDMNCLKFYIFKQRLIYKAIRAGKRVVLVDEYFTTQCCSKCGNLWPSIGDSKTYICQNNNCNHISDRDINASKNICMKGMLRC